MRVEEYANRWLREDGPSALVLREYLLPVEGKDAVFFPPTFLPVDRAERSTYVIDILPDGRTACLVDTVESQANRIEGLFMLSPYRELVPQIVIKVGTKTVNLLEAGHRIADGVVRFSELREEVNKALEEMGRGNAVPIAKIGPTSFIFGAWDSRETMVKISRILRSEIRAFNVDLVSKAGQYISPVDYVREGVVSEEFMEEHGSRWGLRPIPVPKTIGGVILRAEGSIRRDAILNFVGLRALGKPGDDAETGKLQRYVLGLALAASTAPQDYNLRQGCLLSRVREPEYEEVYKDGRREKVSLVHEEVLEYAKKAALEFGVGESKTVSFLPPGKVEEIIKEAEKKKVKG